MRRERIGGEPHVYTEKKRARDQLRRARKRDTEAELIVSREVFERDGWVCGICAEFVDSALAWPNPGSASLDHIVPLAKGGSHTYGNVQCAHLRCNIVKNDALPTGREVLVA